MSLSNVDRQSIKRSLEKIDRSVAAYCVYDEASLEAVLEASKEWSINA